MDLLFAPLPHDGFSMFLKGLLATNAREIRNRFYLPFFLAYPKLVERTQAGEDASS
jgi:hypothetical protein